MESETQTSKPDLIARVGAIVLVTSMVALGALELWCGAPLPGLHALPDAHAALNARIVGALLCAGSLALLVSRWRRAAGGPLALIWGACAVFAALAALAEPFDMTAWVPVLEALVFALAALAIGGRTPHFALRIGLGAMLMWFGATHLMKRDLIVSLIPDWIPYAEHWPWFTGGLMVAAGFACAFRCGARWGALAVAAMFSAWLPLVHAQRIAANPDSLFEWTFAVTACALVGVALVVASSSRSSPRQRRAMRAPSVRTEQ